MTFRRENLRLYAITDRAETDEKTFLRQIEEALQGGITILQLREKKLSEEAFISEAIQVKNLCRKYKVPLIINDNVEVALKCGADGVHVGIEDQPVSEIRRRTGRDFIIGATAKTRSQAKTAELEGADYLGVGAVFPSPTKKTAIRITKEQLQEITSSVTIPCVAIGGITLDNMSALKGSGASGIAVVSAVFGAENIRTACNALKEKIRSVIEL